MNHRIRRNKDNHYRELALYYRNRAKMNRCFAAVHLEADDDKVFWNKVFHHFLPQYRFDYITYSRTMEGNRATGCQTCLKYYRLGCLSKEFFICIDSDYRWLLQEPDMDMRHFIFQTYTYSFENHHCYPGNIRRAFEKMGWKTQSFDFQSFLKHYSIALYDLFIHLLLSLSKGDGIFPTDEFNSLLGIEQYGWNEHQILSGLQASVATKQIELQGVYSSSELQGMKDRCFRLGLKPENAYLYFRGHNIFDQVVRKLMKQTVYHLEKRASRHYSAKEKQEYFSRNKKSPAEYLIEDLSFNQYDAVARIEADTKIYKQLI